MKNSIINADYLLNKYQDSGIIFDFKEWVRIKEEQYEKNKLEEQRPAIFDIEGAKRICTYFDGLMTYPTTTTMLDTTSLYSNRRVWSIDSFHAFTWDELIKFVDVDREQYLFDLAYVQPALLYEAIDRNTFQPTIAEAPIVSPLYWKVRLAF